MESKFSLLVADDEELIRSKVRLMLGDHFEINEADSVRLTREYVAKGYDAIMLDIVFPDGNGIELCQEIKERDPHSTVVISSSMESVDAWDKAFQAGADGYLEKRDLLSIDPRKMVLMISNLVERNRLRRQAEETSRRQTELMSVLSHDIRAPFQAILGTVQMLMKGDMPSEAEQNVQTLYHCAKDQLAFINSLLELLRLESGTIELRPIEIDPNLPIKQCINNLSIIAKSKDISLESDLQLDVSPILGDPGRIVQLVQNLVTNAIKFSHRGDTVTVRTRETSEHGNRGVEISVEDNGVGIKPEDRQTVLQRFKRGREKGTEGETGTGLGLSICKQIVQLHGGTLQISDRKTGGTLIAAWLPKGLDDNVGRLQEVPSAEQQNREEGADGLYRDHPDSAGAAFA
jgi:signal transduction histidine kinase